jgi:hypothetical protein
MKPSMADYGYFPGRPDTPDFRELAAAMRASDARADASDDIVRVYWEFLRLRGAERRGLARGLSGSGGCTLSGGLTHAVPAAAAAACCRSRRRAGDRRQEARSHLHLAGA